MSNLDSEGRNKKVSHSVRKRPQKSKQKHQNTSASVINSNKKIKKTEQKEIALCKQYLDLSPSLFILLDIEGNIQYLNKSALEILKCDSSVIGENWFSTFVSPSDREALRENFQEIISEKNITDVENIVHILNSGNEEKTLILRHAFVYNDDGAIKGLIYSGMDITNKIQIEKERQIVEEKIRHTQQLESVGILTKGIAHDLNNLLVGIIGNADLAMTEITPDSTASYYLKEIVRISKELSHLTQELLTYACKEKTLVKPISLTTIIKNISDLIELSIPKKIIMKYDLDENLPLINADSTYIRQLIINLVSNAADAIGEKSGVITIITKQMYCDSKYWQTTYFGEHCKEGDYVYLEIIDNGKGIARDVLERIFEPFFTTKLSGRGLGLSAVAGIVQAYHGAIKIYTELGKGTSFKVLFPTIESSKTPSQKIYHSREKQEPKTKNRQILVVDDEQLVRETIKNMLEMGDYQVILATNGEEAIDTYMNNRDQIDLVILDMSMPVMDGEETFRELRRINSEVKVILTSGYNEKDVLERFIGKGLTGFIQKPFILSTFLETIKSITEKE